MEATKTTQIPLPFSCTKADLLRMYGTQMPDSFIRNQINTIIQEKRKLPIGTVPKASKILHIELIEFVETYGLPKGYYLPENW